MKLPEAVKIVILPQDVADGYDHAACTPGLMEPIKQHLAKYYSANLIQSDPHRILQSGIAHEVFSKKYCPPIGSALGANVFIMSRLELTFQTSPCDDDRYWVRVKVYSDLSKIEKIVFEQKDVPKAEISTLLEGKEKSILQEIAKIALPLSS